MFDDFGKEINEDSGNLTFKLDGKILLRTDSCSSMNINIATILDAELKNGNVDNGDPRTKKYMRIRQKENYITSI